MNFVLAKNNKISKKSETRLVANKKAAKKKSK